MFIYILSLQILILIKSTLQRILCSVGKTWYDKMYTTKKVCDTYIKEATGDKIFHLFQFQFLLVTVLFNVWMLGPSIDFL